MLQGAPLFSRPNRGRAPGHWFRNRWPVGQVLQCTVGAAGRMASDAGCWSSRQRLLRGDAMLRASSSLADAGVEDGAQLTVVVEAADVVVSASGDGTAKQGGPGAAHGWAARTLAAARAWTLARGQSDARCTLVGLIEIIDNS